MAEVGSGLSARIIGPEVNGDNLAQILVLCPRAGEKNEDYNEYAM